MDACDVLIVGGGPAGAACAWRLRQAGVDVLVIDRAAFPRDKACAGWITPRVLESLQIDPDDYRTRHTLQPISAFRVGVLGNGEAVDTAYPRPVSFGIRRCEFDHYILRRSGARLRFATPLATVRRAGGRWIVNDGIRAPLIVGAGGHFCPVARLLNAAPESGAVVAAQQLEIGIDGLHARQAVEPERPELYFARDLTGYGWILRKGRYLNVGFGTLDHRAVPSARSAFVDFLVRTAKLSSAPPSSLWHGHAYRLAGGQRRKTVGDGLILAGDAAGLADPRSGEGIRPAIESGLLAASAILDAGANYTLERFRSYDDGLRERFGDRAPMELLARAVPPFVRQGCAAAVFASPWLVRRLVLDRWFLHVGEPALAPVNARPMRPASCERPAVSAAGEGA